MTQLTAELVSRYIESAQPFVESKADRLVLQRADDWNTPFEHQRRRNPHVERPAQSKADKTVRSLEELIWDEIHTALCKRTARYRKHIDSLKNNVHLLIGGIAVHVAEKIGLAVAIVAALVAALLRIVLGMGISVFCKKFQSGFF